MPTITLYITINDEVINIELNHSDSTDMLFDAVSLHTSMPISSISLEINEKEIPKDVTIGSLIQTHNLSPSTIITFSTLPIPPSTSQNSQQNLTSIFPPNSTNMADMLNNPELLKQMMQSPSVKSIMSDPTFMKDFMSKDPRFSKLLETNPEIANIFNNQEIMKEVSEAASDPKKLQEMLQSSDHQLQNIMAMPGGHAQLRSVYNNIQKPLEGVIRNFGFTNEDDENEISKKESILESKNVKTKKNFDLSNNEYIIKNPFAKGLEGIKKNDLEIFLKEKLMWDEFGNLIGGKRKKWEDLEDEDRVRWEIGNNGKLDELKELGFVEEERNREMLWDNEEDVEVCVEKLLNIRGK